MFYPCGILPRRPHLLYLILLFPFAIAQWQGYGLCSQSCLERARAQVNCDYLNTCLCPSTRWLELVAFCDSVQCASEFDTTYQLIRQNCAITNTPISITLGDFVNMARRGQALLCSSAAAAQTPVTLPFTCSAGKVTAVTSATLPGFTATITATLSQTNFVTPSTTLPSASSIKSSNAPTTLETLTKNAALTAAGPLSPGSQTPIPVQNIDTPGLSRADQIAIGIGVPVGIFTIIGAIYGGRKCCASQR